MADKTYLTVNIGVTEDERRRIEESAKLRGYDTLDDYVKSLLDADIEETTASLEESFKRAWQDAQQGNLLTEREFWKALQNDD
jgi:predicted GIY-YIG superfamily endonuclease